MISWIQNTFQHHFRTVFAVLLGLIIISFVFTIGPQGRTGGRDHSSRKMPYFGYDLASSADTKRISGDAQVSALLRYGPQMLPYLGGERIAQLGQTRVALLSVADSLHLPAPTKSQREKTILEMRIFADEKGQFDSKRYAEFRDSLKKNTQFSEADILRVMDDDYRIEQVGKIVGGSGHVLDAEVANQLALAGTEWTIRVAELNFASFNPAIQPTEEQLNQYFTTYAGNFQVPKRVNVDAVVFRASAFVDNAPLNEEQLNQFFEQYKSSFTVPAADAGKPAVPATSLVQVRPQVEAAFRTMAGSQRASKAASEFAYTLFDRKVKKDSAELDGYVAQYRGNRSTVPAFDEENGPANAGWPSEVTQEAFRLGDDRYFSTPLQLGSDQVVLLWKNTLASYTPTLAEAREKVIAAYVANERRKQFVESGRLWKSTLEAKLAAGTPLETAVTSLTGAPKTEVKSPAAFTRRQPPEGVSPTVLGAIETMQAGQVSDMLSDAKDGNGYFVQLVARKAPTVDSASTEYTNLRKMLATQNANAFESALLRSMMEAEQKSYARAEPVAAE